MRGLIFSETVTNNMQRNGNRSPGFNALRILLALAIFLAHCRVVYPGAAANLSALTVDAALTNTSTAIAELFAFLYKQKLGIHVTFVPMFFFLSGFLVTGSALRVRAPLTFLRLRAMRILPALSVEVTLSALILGPIFTTLALRDYFFDADFIAYFGNILGVIQYDLPGVFEQNPASGNVNANLWTLPGEFYCYFAILGAMMLGCLNRRFITITMVVATIGLNILLAHDVVSYRGGLYPTLALVYYFFLGVLVFLWRDRVPLNLPLFVLSVLGILLLFRTSSALFVMPVALGYATLYLGHLSWLDLPVLRGRDYSYGIYLYGFPITQAVKATAPQMPKLEFIVVSLGLTLAFAVVSWHLIERPALRYRLVGPRARFCKAELERAHPPT